MADPIQPNNPEAQTNAPTAAHKRFRLGNYTSPKALSPEAMAEARNNIQGIRDAIADGLGMPASPNANPRSAEVTRNIRAAQEDAIREAGIEYNQRTQTPQGQTLQQSQGAAPLPKDEALRRIREVTEQMELGRAIPGIPQEKQKDARTEAIYSNPYSRKKYLDMYDAAHAHEGPNATEREAGIQKISDIFRRQLFENVPPQEWAQKEADLNKAAKQVNKQSQGYVRDYATQMYDNPSTRAMLLGNEREQQEAIQRESGKHIGNAQRQFEGLSTQRSGPMGKAMEIMGGAINQATNPRVLKETAPPQVERESNQNKPAVITFAARQFNGENNEKIIANAIRANRHTSPGGAVDIEKLAATNPDVWRALEISRNWQNENEKSARPARMTEDRALIFQNDYVMLINRLGVDKNNIPIQRTPEESAAYRQAERRSNQADAALASDGKPMDLNHFGLKAMPRIVLPDGSVRQGR